MLFVIYLRAEIYICSILTLCSTLDESFKKFKHLLNTHFCSDYAKKRIKDHIGRFNNLYSQIKNDKIDKTYLEEVYKKDKIFDEIDYMIYY